MIHIFVKRQGGSLHGEPLYLHMLRFFSQSDNPKIAVPSIQERAVDDPLACRELCFHKSSESNRIYLKKYAASIFRHFSRARTNCHRIRLLLLRRRQGQDILECGCNSCDIEVRPPKRRAEA